MLVSLTGGFVFWFWDSSEPYTIQFDVFWWWVRNLGFRWWLLRLFLGGNSTAFLIWLISAWIELKADSCCWCFSLFSDKFRSSSWLFLSTHLLHTCRTFFPSSLRPAIAVSEKPVQIVVRWRMQSRATQRKTSSLEGMSLLHVLHLPWVSEADFRRVLCIMNDVKRIENGMSWEWNVLVLEPWYKN